MACFADINVSQGRVATFARCGGMFNIRLTANLLRNLPVIFFLNLLRFDRIMVMSLAMVFGPPCICTCVLLLIAVLQLEMHVHLICAIKFYLLTYLCLQCFDAVGWVAGRASGL